MALTYDQLRSATDLEARIPCTTEENRIYSELLNNGQPLPDGIVQTSKGKTILHILHAVKIICPQNKNNYTY